MSFLYSMYTKLNAASGQVQSFALGRLEFILQPQEMTLEDAELQHFSDVSMLEILPGLEYYQLSL